MTDLVKGDTYFAKTLDIVFGELADDFLVGDTVCVARVNDRVNVLYVCKNTPCKTMKDLVEMVPGRYSTNCRIISLSGRDRVGKSTTASALYNELLFKHPDVKVMSFCDALRLELEEYYNIPVEVTKWVAGTMPKMLVDWCRSTGKKLDRYSYKDTVTFKMADLKLSNLQQEAIRYLWSKNQITEESVDIFDTEFTIRDFLIIHGTKIRRNTDPGYWVNKTKKLIDESYTDEEECVIIFDDMRFRNEFEMLNEYDTLFVWLDNGLTGKGRNEIEQLALAIYRDHKDSFKYLKVPVPLTKESISQTVNSVIETRHIV